MSDNHPERVVDPVCGMSVDVEHAEAQGLTADHEGRRFAFCRSGCQRAFLEDPAAYAAAASTAHVAAVPWTGTASARALPVIDEGMRLWYDACSCCLSEAFPEVKSALDAERAAAAPEAGAVSTAASTPGT